MSFQRRWKRIATALLAVCALLTSLESVGAQTTEELRQRAESILGRSMTDADILRLLRSSGLSADDIRERLTRRGLDPAAADPYLGVLEGRVEEVPVETDPIPILRALDLLSDQQVAGVTAPPPVIAPPPSEEEPELGPPIFGRDLFGRATSQFEPAVSGPVPGSYRLGPGDEIVLVITGGVELAYELSVTREGWIVIPDVGRLLVNGLTLEDLERTLFQRLSQVYSGIQRGPDATTFFDVTVGSLRTNQVFLVGEVELPSAYEVSSLATALTALYAGGGPSRNGSFREIVVNRGGVPVHTLDLYDYLMRGTTGRDIRLEDGDVVFVPVAGPRVLLSGAVVRPALYELVEGEGLHEVLQYAGGLQANAELRSVQIERVLPPAERLPGQDRAVLDVPLMSLEDLEAAPVPLKDGDRITVFAVLDEVRNEVTVSGGVWRPGSYAAAAGTRLWDIIERAGGLVPDAVEGRAQIQRLQPDYTRRLIPVTLARTPSGDPAENPPVEGMDQIVVYTKRSLRDERVVSVGGWVREPGVYPFIDGTTVADLILRAGGLRTGAYLAQAEVSRVELAQERSDTLARRFIVPLDSSLVFDGSGGPRGNGPAGTSEAERFVLENLDAVYVRKAPGFELQQTVAVTGEVRFAGPYSLASRGDRLMDIIERAGGLTPEAYAKGLQLWRAQPADQTGESPTELLESISPEPETGTDSAPIFRIRVGIDFEQALADPRAIANVLVEPDDSIFVPRYIPTVDVRGAVAVPTRVLHREGADFDYYIRQAGGYREDADEERVRLRFANGEVSTRGGRFLFLGGGMPKPDPGSVITVPEKAPREGEGLRITEFVALVTSVMTAAASVIIASSR